MCVEGGFFNLVFLEGIIFFFTGIEERLVVSLKALLCKSWIVILGLLLILFNDIDGVNFVFM